MKTLIIWVWAFGFAILNHLAKNNWELQFYSYEKDQNVLKTLQERRQNPYFYPNTFLPSNVVFLESLETLSEFDLVIIALPAQYIWGFVREIKQNLKPWVTFLNLSKGIDNTTLQTPSDILKQELWDFDYHYAILSWGMIAGELVDEKILWAQIATENMIIGEKIKTLFQSQTLEITLTTEYKNIELYGSLKNVFALYMGYLEWKWYAMSSIGYYFCELYKELPELLLLLWGTRNIDFWDFALGGDMIATCFWNSRNRYFWKLVGEWNTPKSVEEKLKLEKKHAEGYYTLMGIKEVIYEHNFPHFSQVACIFAKD